MDDLREAARDFFRRGIEKTGWSPYKWGKTAHVAPTTITRLLNDPDYTVMPKVETLRKLALAAGMEVPNVLKATESMDIVPVLASIPVIGDVRAGSWEHIPDELEIKERLPMEVLGYEGVSLFAVRVVGRSMDLVYPDGTYVVCAPPAEVGLQEGDCVVVRRRDAANRFETTLKEILKAPGGRYILQPRSSDPDHQESIEMPRRDEMADDGIVIMGIVVAEYRKSRRGRGPLLQA